MGSALPSLALPSLALPGLPLITGALVVDQHACTESESGESTSVANTSAGSVQHTYKRLAAQLCPDQVVCIREFKEIYTAPESHPEPDLRSNLPVILVPHLSKVLCGRLQLCDVHLVPQQAPDAPEPLAELACLLYTSDAADE